MIAWIACSFFLLSDVFFVTIGKSPKTLDCIESTVFSSASSFALYVPTVTPMSEGEGEGEGEDEGESSPSKMLPPVQKCRVMIINKNSINEWMINLFNIDKWKIETSWYYMI